ncbi:MAG TPA: hypothetical protein VFL17_04365 [Anaerolineae bacterium]|nr:hypothetical protein [Anaerolineae bacterium]
MKTYHEQASRFAAGRAGNRRTLIAWLLILTSLAVLTACGGSVQSSPGGGVTPSAQPTRLPAEATKPEVSAGGVDTCALVIQEEAEAALGKPVGEPQRADTPPVYTCTYEADGFDNVGIIVVEYDDEQQAADAFQMAIDINDYEESSGIGERAYRSLIIDITVLTGRYELSIDVSDSSDQEAQFQKARDLAEKALARMP